jgi:hypothetical protein
MADTTGSRELSAFASAFVLVRVFLNYQTLIELASEAE